MTRTPMAVLQLPFDQYQRYRVAADLFAGLGIGAGARVLEVGGAPGPLEAFLPDHEIFVVDIAGKRGGRYAIADGARLPFRDATFDAVVSLDTLEHVFPKSRTAFLSELHRVTSDAVVLSAPFADPELEMAEDALNSFVRQRFGGDFPTLDEHREHGLPLLAPTVAALGAGDWTTAVLPSGYLPRWLLGMLFHHELLATGLAELGELHAYYNATVSSLDTREPAYRHVIVAGRLRAQDELDKLVDSLLAPGDERAGEVALASIAAAVLAKRLPASIPSSEAKSLQDTVARLERQVADLERQVADRDAHLVEVRMLAEGLAGERDDAVQRLLEQLSGEGLVGFAARAARALRRLR